MKQEFEIHPIQWDDEKVNRYWNQIARNQSFNDIYFTKQGGEEIIKYLNTKIGLSEKKILDYGSGPGYLFEYMAKQNLQVEYHALDFSKESVSLLESKFFKHPAFKKAYYVEKFPTDITERFDIIIVCEVIEHLDDVHLSNLITELKKLLSPDGYVFITTPNDEDMQQNELMCPDCGCLYHRWQHVRSWNATSLNAFMEQQGFETKIIEAINIANIIKLFNKFRFFLKKLMRKPVSYGNLIYIGKKK